MSPEMILALGGILTLAVGLIGGNRKPGRTGILSPEVVGLLTLVAALIPSVILMARMFSGEFEPSSQFGGLFAVDALALFFKPIAIVSTAMVMLLAVDYFRRIDFHRGEFYALLVFATLAITSLAASTDLIMIYVSLEFLSITSYILVGYLKRDPKSSEAAIKYFLFGAVSGAVMLYGMSIVYGLTGATGISGILHAFRDGLPSPPLRFMALAFVLVGFGFKIAMVPFHQWTPDTYEGAPTPITAFLSVGSKAAGFAVLIRVLSAMVPPDVVNWAPLIMLLCGVTMTVGNLIAIPQTNIKRMLAYSSIAQAGYLLLGITAMGFDSALAVPAVLIYLMAYLFMNLGAFAVVTILSARLRSDKLCDYAGLIRRAPVAAACMAIFMLSLAGLPPTAGFLGKLYLFTAVIQVAQDAGSSAMLWLVVVAGINTIISVYYYFNVVRVVFFLKAEDEEPIESSRPLGFVIALATIMTFAILIYAQPFIKIAHLSANMLP
jgi:proton-translocating NADH-quinone oxidoreductase chain N